MSDAINLLESEIRRMNEKISHLEQEILLLKETFAPLGYSIEDSQITGEELREVDEIKELVRKGDLTRFKELE